MVNYELAVQLRKQGMKYQEIANHLGCSLDWCKRNLKGIKKYPVIQGNSILSEKETKILSQIIVIRRELNKLEKMLIPS